MNSPLNGTQSRIGVVGHERLGFAESFSWQSERLPNFADFQYLIVDLRTLAAPARIAADDLRVRVRKGLYRQVQAGGQAVVILDQPLRHLNLNLNGPSPKAAALPISCALPFIANFVEESGRTIESTDPGSFRRYLASLCEFDFHFTIDSLQPEWNIVSGAGGVTVRPLRVNNERIPLAASVQFGDGTLHVLPNVRALEPRKSIEYLYEDMIGTSVRSEVPAWIGKVPVFGLKDIDAAIDQKEKKIREIEVCIEGLKTERCSLSEFSALVYADGKHLENVVRRALETLGGVVKPAVYADEEYVLEVDGAEVLIEVKGVAKSASLEHLSQALQHQLTAESKTGRRFKSLLIVNAWKHSLPEERVPPAKSAVPDNVVKRSLQFELPILTGWQLLRAVNRVLAGEAEGRHILRRILSTSGPVTDDSIDG